MVKWTRFLFLIIVANAVLFSAAANANACLANMSSHVINLDTLWLDECHITDQEIPQIIAYLAHHPKITQLYLLNNRIGDAGAILLAKNKTLKLLELRNNLISVRGAKALTHSAIHVLDIQGNKLNPVHLSALHKHAALSPHPGAIILV